MAIIRLILGKLILLFNWLFTPRGIARDASAQAAIDRQTESLRLYQYEACPFCVKVRRAMKRMSLNIETRDIKRVPAAREELLAGGGNLKVPCLRVEREDGQVNWMYESGDIINYLSGRFTSTSSN
ncbi:glutaredoxin family protein [Pseudohalioglobus lutimaris]|uniref:Glutaredoxin n=1 Tax=Pseudohalioglobus lutimaris TaxID=1737061 RepID=A0A2N5X890_9GAMM|nr:glutaredoxin domain-containing protein [Pseudohalioglobus lutimaris]PLW70714.1 glutaredoxin [Pseudohalioglobus lutimaris]